MNAACLAPASLSAIKEARLKEDVCLNWSSKREDGEHTVADQLAIDVLQLLLHVPRSLLIGWMWEQVWRTRPAFQDRAALDAYELALRHAGRLDHALEVILCTKCLVVSSQNAA